MTDKPTVYIVDDENSVLRSLSFLFHTQSIPCKTYDSFAAYAEDTNLDAPGCLLLDLRLRGETGDAILESLRQTILADSRDFDERRWRRIVGSKVPQTWGRRFSRKANRALSTARKVRNALLLDSERRQEKGVRDGAQMQIAKLTPRERELANCVCEGLSNKQIALRLAISKNTVANHRAHILSKMNAINTADLVRIGMTGGGFGIGRHAETEKDSRTLGTIARRL